MDVVGKFDCYSVKDMAYHDLYDDANTFWLNSECLFKANQKGLLDPEAFVQKHENLMAKLAEGQVLSAPFQWQISSVNATLEAAGSAGMVDIPFADTPDFPAWVDRSSPFGYTARMFLVSSKCDETKLKGIMRLLDFLYSEDGSRVIMNGVEGVTWEKAEDGTAQFTQEAITAMASDPGYLASQGANKYLGIVGQDYDAYDSTGERFIDLTLNSDFVSSGLADYEKEYCDFYGVEVPLEVLTKRTNQTVRNLAYSGLLPTNIPTEISRITTKVEDYLSQQFPVLVMSSDQAAYDAKLAQMRDDLKSMDYDKVRDFYKDAFEQAVIKYDEMSK